METDKDRHYYFNNSCYFQSSNNAISFHNWTSINPGEAFDLRKSNNIAVLSVRWGQGAGLSRSCFHAGDLIVQTLISSLPCL